MSTSTGALTRPAPLSGHQIALRVVIAVAPMLSLIATGAEVGPANTWTLAAVAIFGFAAAALPDTHVPMLVLIYLGWHWAVVVDDIRTPWTLWTAGCMLAMHAAAALSATGPRPTMYSRLTMMRWLTRTAIVAAATAAAWALSYAVQSVRIPGSVLLFAAGVLVAVGLLLALRVLARPSERR